MHGCAAAEADPRVYPVSVARPRVLISHGKRDVIGAAPWPHEDAHAQLGTVLEKACTGVVRGLRKSLAPRSKFYTLAYPFR